MEAFGHPLRRLLAGRRASGWLWGALAALVSMGFARFMWGFTVDDALISVRYARHVAGGVGYRFNPDGPSTDGVTPLPWVFVLAPLARGAPFAVLEVAKWIGALATALGAACLVGKLAQAKEQPLEARICGALLIVGPLPVCAYAASGMETGMATLGISLAAACWSRPRWAAACAGLAATFRPELGPFAVTVALLATRARADARTPLRLLGALGLAVAPFGACVVARLVLFGRPAPLALSAKPSDLSHGLVYALAAVLVGAVPVAALALIFQPRERRDARSMGLGVAFLVHVVTVVVVGGDWMPFARLMAPVLPALAFALGAAPIPAWRGWVRRLFLAPACLLLAFTWAHNAPEGRQVSADREALARAAAPLLGRTVATIDVGWPSAARDDVTLVDLAGLTDPEIAFLAGGHTSKRVDPGMLLARDVDTLLLFSATPTRGPGGEPLTPSYTRVLDARLGDSSVIARHFEDVGYVRLGSHGGYQVLRKREPPAN